MVKKFFVKVWYVFYHLGGIWVVFRLYYALKSRFGFLKRQLPSTSWADQPLAHLLSDPSLGLATKYFEYRSTASLPFFFSPSQRSQYSRLLALWYQDNSLSEAEGILRGEFCYFVKHHIQLTFPPDWHYNPFTKTSIPSASHWSQIADFGYGDIKIVWELNRFSFVYPLVRAYWRTGDPRYAEGFWQLVEDWVRQNPPQQGANWKCGQEISLRIMAWCFGLYGFLDSPASTPERVALLAQAIGVSGHRIATNFRYALSQRNNHGISEAMGLWTIGLLFPELRLASRWRKLGREALEKQGLELIYEDGAFAQHSVNYQRLMLHDYLWASRLGALHGQHFTPTLHERLKRACLLLYNMQDQKSGMVPYYGQNDGSLILPLSNCDYHDFRPIVQSTYYLIHQARCYQEGPWDEDLLWLFGPEALKAPIEQLKNCNLIERNSGYYTLRSPEGCIFTRCAEFRHRPGQADLLHIDLWWRGQNIALDAGTYSYNAPVPWNNPFSHTTYHNTVTVDSRDQMERVSKFLWLPWVKGKMRTYCESATKQIVYWEGEHNGYCRLSSPVHYRRGIVGLGNDSWIIVDRLQSTNPHDYRLHWLFPDIQHLWDDRNRHLHLKLLQGSYHVYLLSSGEQSAHSVVRADPSSPRGWHAPYYNDRTPALSVAVEQRSNSVFFLTIFSSDLCYIENNESTLALQANSWNATLHKNSIAHNPLINTIDLRGNVNDRLEVHECMPC